MVVRRLSLLEMVLIAVTVVGLAIDAGVHLDLASAFEPVKTDAISQADLFRIEAAAAIVAALALLIRPRPWSAALCFVVAAAGLVAVVVYRYVDVGQIGPIPNMYDPFWGPTGKWVSAVAEAAATLSSAALFVLFRRRALQAPREPSDQPAPAS